MTAFFDAPNSGASLPYARLVREIELLLDDPSVQVPPRLVLALPGGSSLFVMPALDSRLAITKLITFTPGNAGTVRPAIQGDVVVFEIATGIRALVLDGPTVTARRTAAVSLLAAQRLAPNPAGPLLIVGAGAQGRSHLEAFAEGLPIEKVWIASRSDGNAQVLAQHARTLGLEASVVSDPNLALAECPLAVICTPATGVVLTELPRADAFIAAIGAFTPAMVELGAGLCRYFADCGNIILDTPDARHEAGDLLQAGLDTAAFPTLRDVVIGSTWTPPRGPVLFKSCGWAGWDLAAARVALAVR